MTVAKEGKTPPVEQTSPTEAKPANQVPESTFNSTVMVASSIGALAGLGYAFAQKKQFWGYVGFFVLGSIAGTLVGNVISSKK